MPGFPQEGFGVTECGTNCKCSLVVNELSIDELDKDDPEAIDVPPIIIDDGETPTKGGLDLSVALTPEYQDKRKDLITEFESKIIEYETDINVEIKRLTNSQEQRGLSANTIRGMQKKARSKKAKADVQTLLTKLETTSDDILLTDIPIDLRPHFVLIRASQNINKGYTEMRGAQHYVDFLEKQQAIENMPHQGQYTDRDRFFDLRNKMLAKDEMTAGEQTELKNAYSSIARVLTKSELDNEKDVMIESVRLNSTGWNNLAEESLKVLPLRLLHKVSGYNDRYDNLNIEVKSAFGRAFYHPQLKTSTLYLDSKVRSYIHENLHGVDNILGGGLNYGLADGKVQRFVDDNSTNTSYAYIADEMKGLYNNKAGKGYKYRTVDGIQEEYRNGKWIHQYAGRVYGAREGQEYITMNGQTVLSLKAMADTGTSLEISEAFVELAKKDKEFIEWSTRFFAE